MSCKRCVDIPMRPRIQATVPEIKMSKTALAAVDIFGINRTLILSYFKCYEPESKTIRKKNLPPQQEVELEDEIRTLSNTLPKWLRNILESYLEKAKKQFSNGHASEPEKEREECFVSLSEMNPMSVGKLPCGHIFCRTCVEEWLKNSNTCPMCRREVDIVQCGSLM